ncbi:diphthamide synthesis protein [Candidatus Woesearchaeota archaeon]|nr:diphthamide synthesis protein [Candidatus Woesearchaeota archaeon]
MEYDLEIEKAIDKVKQEHARRVCIQLPDGLKTRSKEICDRIQQATGATVIIWAGSNFGACDLALDVERIGVDLLLAWGHTEWQYRTA